MKRKAPFLFFILLALFAACEEDDILGLNENSLEVQLGEYFVEIEGLANRIYTNVDAALRELGPGMDTIYVDGATVSRFGNDILIDYGTGVVGEDGVTRRGEILVEITGSIDDWRVEGAAATVTINEYWEDDAPVLGTFELSNNGEVQGNPPAYEFEIEVIDFSIDNRMVLNSNKTLRWISGFETYTEVNDDSFTLTGTSDGDSPDGTLQATIAMENALLYDRSCAVGLIEGIFAANFEGDSVTYQSGTLNFISEDDCNNIYEIVLIPADGGSEVQVKKSFKGF